MPKEKVFELLLSFFLIVTGGALLNNLFQNDSWNREAKFELIKDEVAHNQSEIAGLTSLVDKRLFAAQQIINALKDDSPDIDSNWSSYMSTVAEWNGNVSEYQAWLDSYAGSDVGAQLLTYEDDLNNQIPTSLHYKFYDLHQNLLNLKNCAEIGCNRTSDLKRVDELNAALISQKQSLATLLNTKIETEQNAFRTSPSDYLNKTK